MFLIQLVVCLDSLWDTSTVLYLAIVFIFQQCTEWYFRHFPRRITPWRKTPSKRTWQHSLSAFSWNWILMQSQTVNRQFTAMLPRYHQGQMEYILRFFLHQLKSILRMNTGKLALQSKGRFRRYDFCSTLSHATFVARDARVIEKILNNVHHLSLPLATNVVRFQNLFQNPTTFLCREQ